MGDEGFEPPTSSDEKSECAEPVELIFTLN